MTTFAEKVARAELVTFDAGNTLAVPHPSVGEIYAEVAAAYGLTLDPGETDQRFFAAFKEATHAPKDAEAVKDDKNLWRIVVRASLPDALPDGFPYEVFFDELYASFAHGHRWRLLPGAREIVEALVAKGKKVAVLSNADARFRQVFTELGMTEFFTEMFISGEIGVEKPDLRIFRHVETSTGVAPGKILHLGDSVIHDVQGAEAAGWQAAHVTRERGLDVLLRELET